MGFYIILEILLFIGSIGSTFYVIRFYLLFLFLFDDTRNADGKVGGIWA